MSTTPPRAQRRRQGGTALKRKVPLPPQLKQINLNAVGIDIGSEEHWAAVPPGRDREGQDVRRFEAFSGSLCALADWLKQCEIETVAMESTGVYWIALYELLVERGFEVLLVDARRVKNVPGRKTDVLDCQWLQELHTYGLLRGAFRPADQVCILRSYLRQRAMLVAYASHHIQHMQKALEQMNLKAHPCGQRYYWANRHGNHQGHSQGRARSGRTGETTRPALQELRGNGGPCP